MPEWSDPFFREAHGGEAHYDIVDWEKKDFTHHKGPPKDLADAESIDLHVWDKEGNETAFRLYGPIPGWEYVDSIIEEYIYDEDADYPLK